MDQNPQPRSVSDPIDSELHCPTCDYNLAGLTVSRCPECGTAFDLSELRANSADHPRPIPVWDDRANVNRVTAFFRTCFATWFTPGHFASQFPRSYDARSAARFRLLCSVVAVGLLWLSACIVLLIATLGKYVPQIIIANAIVVVPGVLVGVAVCELIATTIFAKWVELRGTGTSAGRPDALWTHWRGLVGFYRSFLILSAGTFGSAMFVQISRPSSYLSLPSTILGMAVLVWWYSALVRAIAVRTVPTAKRLVAFTMIPLIALGTAALGGVVSALFSGCIQGI